MALVKDGIDCYFILENCKILKKLGQQAVERDSRAFKYWSKRYKEAKDSLLHPKGYATLIDAHRFHTKEKYKIDLKISKLAVRHYFCKLKKFLKFPKI